MALSEGMFTKPDPIVEPTVEKYYGLKPIGRLFGKEILDKHVAELKLPTDYSFNDPKCLVGIEVEVERITRVDPNTTLMLWQMREDGSLRNNGREFVTPPIPSFFSYPALHLLFNGLNADHDFSKRTSIHVHVNVRNMTAQEVLATLLIYHSVEPLLFDFVGGNRTNNIFCVPWTNSDFLANRMGGKDHWATLANLRNMSEKYSALNILPLETFGTLEFRHMPGTSEVQKIVRWIDMVTAIRLYAVKNGFEKVLTEICNLNSNSQYEKYLESVFGPSLKPFFDTSNISIVMERNVVDIKSSLLTAVFHNKKMGYDPNDLYKSAMAIFFKGLLGSEPKAKTKKPKTLLDPEVRRWANMDEEPPAQEVLLPLTPIRPEQIGGRDINGLRFREGDQVDRAGRRVRPGFGGVPPRPVAAPRAGARRVNLDVRANVQFEEPAPDAVDAGGNVNFENIALQGQAADAMIDPLRGLWRDINFRQAEAAGVGEFRPLFGQVPEPAVIPPPLVELNALQAWERDWDANMANMERDEIQRLANANQAMLDDLRREGNV